MSQNMLRVDRAVQKYHTENGGDGARDVDDAHETDLRPSAQSAAPTAAVGKTSFSRIVSKTTMPTLPGQRCDLVAAQPRFGLASSQRAMAAKTPRKTLKRIQDSWFRMKFSRSLIR